MNDIKERVIEALSKSLAPSKAIELTDRIVDDLGADSLDLVEVIMNIEDNFSVSIPENESESLVTVGDLVAYLEKVTAK